MLGLIDYLQNRAGKYTKDLAICVHGTNKVTPDQYLNTSEFMDEIAERLVASQSSSRSKL